MKLLRNIDVFIIRHFLLSVAFAMLFAACSDDGSPRFAGGDQLPEGSLSITLIVPEPTVVKSRAGNETGESDINECALFVFSADGTTLLASETLDNVTSNIVQVMVPLRYSADNKQVYVIANANAPVKDISTIAELQEVVLSVAEATGTGGDTKGFVMIGCAEVNGNTTSVTIDMNRIVAKMTVSLDSSIKNYMLRQYDVENANSNVNLATTLIESKKYNSDESEIVMCYTAGYTTYLAPTRFWSYNGNDDAPVLENYLLLALGYNEDGDFSKATTNYYCLTLETEENGVPKPIDVEANHYYIIEIEDVLGNGYSSPDEARRHPESKNLLKYTIHDHASQVMSMVTDGIRELGVTGDFNWDEKAAESDGDVYVTVKWYSPYGDEMNGEMPMVSLQSAWLSIDGGTELTDTGAETSGNHNGDGDNAGRRMKYRLSLNPMAPFDTDAIIEVTWMGLKRTITVSRSLTADLGSLCNVELNINVGGANMGLNNELANKVEYIRDYWAFLAGNETENINGAPVRLFGVDKNAMGAAKPRDAGLHFAVMYGEDPENWQKQWRYQYKVDFSNLYGDEALITNVTFPEGDHGLAVNGFSTTLTGPQKSVYIQMDNYLLDYSYWTTIIRFTVQDAEGALHTHDITAYHTGFFHYHGEGEIDDPGYYYYEVVPFDINGRNYYWLDRNLGAKSCGMYIESSAGTTQYGNADASGSYLTVATPGKWNVEGQQDPKPLEALCPPGYHVPSKTEWNRVRTAPGFSLERQRDPLTNEYFYTAQFETADRNIGNVYFPKGRYHDGNGKAGEAATGYYWTVTPAEGMEKEQIGQWLQVLTLSGSASSYINGNIEDKTASRAGHRMSVRCAAGAAAETDVKNTISFNVRGATNVYIFDRNSKTPLFPFPGKTIGTSAASQEWIMFSYVSTHNADELAVLFTKVDENGKIVLFTPEGEASTAFTFKVNEEFSLNEAMDNGWPVYIGGAYDFSGTPGHYSKDNANVRPDSDKLYQKTSFAVGDVVVISWNNSLTGLQALYNCNEVQIRYPSGNDQFVTDVGNSNIAVYDKADNYYDYYLTIQENCEYFSFTLYNSMTSIWSQPIEISFNEVKKSGEKYTIELSTNRIKQR